MTSNRARISILIAVYNGAEVLSNSIESLRNQSLKEIEIICVDDFSSDDSLSVLEKYAKDDQRIRIVHFDSNRGTVCARKAGVEAATGEYIMFMDQDDSYEPSACKELYELIQKKNVDILHFRSRVIAIPPTTEKQRKWQEDFLRPYNGLLNGNDVFDYCFRPNRAGKNTWNLYTWNVWNKIYKSDVCKAAMKECREDYVINGDDVYIYMLIAYYAKSYFGDAKGKFYHVYRLGTGLMGNYTLSMKKFYTICCRATSVRNEAVFFKDKNYDKYQDVISLDKCRAVCGIVQRWFQRLDVGNRSDGFDMMLEHLDYLDVIAGFEKHVKCSYSDLLKGIYGAKSISVQKNEIKTIGIYLSKDLNVSGKVDDLFISKLRQKGYEVVIFSEGNLSKQDNIERHVVLPWTEKGEIYSYPIRNRIECIRNALINEKVDLFIYTGRKNSLMVYDYLTVKCGGVPFLLDMCELPSYMSKENHDIEGLYSYLMMMIYSDGIMISEPKMTELFEDIGIKLIDENNIVDIVVGMNDGDADKTSGKRLRFIIRYLFFQKLSMEFVPFMSSDKSEKVLFRSMLFKELKNSGMKMRIRTAAKLFLRIFGIRYEISCKSYDRYQRFKRIISEYI